MRPAARALKVAWVHERATASGGIERYVRETAAELGRVGVQSTLFYDVATSPRPDPEQTEPFVGAYPMVDLEAQLAQLAPDVVYVHRTRDPGVSEVLERSPWPVVRFFHDHELFCLREHKYTTIGQQTCTKATGLGCYSCLGFVARSNSFPPVKLVTLEALRRRQRAARGARAFVVASAYMAGHIARHGFDDQRISVLPLFSAPPALAPVVRRRHSSRLLTVGLVSTGKGIDVLLRALLLMREPARLDVVGRGPQEDRFRALTRGLGLASRVSFHGWVAPKRLEAHFAEATALVFPSRAPETFGLVGIEAMSYGLPVVASDVGGVREWLRHGETGLLVPPGDPPELARALDHLLESPDVARRFGENGRAEHARRFVARRHVDGLLALFDRLASAERKAA